MKGKNPKETALNYIIVLLVIIVLIVGGYFLFKNNFENKYQKMEKLLVSRAGEYVKQNNLVTSNEIYLDVTKLGITLDDNCKITSGVFYSNDSYKPYLICSDYQSKILSTQNDYLNLIGNDVYVIAKGVNFYDPGYQSGDNVNVVSDIKNEEGVYNIYYSPQNSNGVLIRKVVIIDNPQIKELFPVIKMYGDSVSYTIQGKKYIDSGVMASDINDEDITMNVQVIGNVDTSKLGNYSIEYVITNNQGYTNSIKRIVEVVSPNSDLQASASISPNVLTSKNVDINIQVIGDDFKYAILPDLSEVENKNITYTVFDNGIYNFVIYDDKGRSINETVTVNNIDRTKPNASCTATWRYNKTDVEVTITSERKIINYKYNIDNNIYNSEINTYTSTQIKPQNITVNVIDELENEENITCDIIDKSIPQIYIDSNGKRCLEGYTCYVQRDFDDSRYNFCADAAGKSCGTIAGHGCSITSFATAVSKFETFASNGKLHTPYTLLTEIYNGTGISHNGVCGGGCSGWSPMKRAALALGLSSQEKYLPFNKNNVETFKNYLRKGYAVILAVGPGPYSTGKHIIAALGIRDDDYIYLYNTNPGDSNTSLEPGFKQNDWIPISDLLNGNVGSFLAVGPASK